MLTTYLALLCHVVGGGVAPSALAVGICVAAVTWVAVLVGRARPSLPLLVAAIAIAQVVLHTAFSVATATATVAGDGHGAHGPLTVTATGSGHAMWPAHVLAGILTVVAIRRGESLLRGLLEVARLGAAVLLRRVVLVVVPRPLAAIVGAIVAVPVDPVTRVFESVVQRRGPPAFAA